LTPANNGTADPTINWAIGMAPSAVDPSARSMMARTAEWRDDISGKLLTGGSGTAYTVTTNQSVSGTGANGICGSGTTPLDGQLLTVTAHATNGASPTFKADGCSAIAIQSQAGVAVPAGTMIAQTPYQLKYSTTNTAWMLVGFFSSSYGVPIGAMVPYTAGSTPGSNFILPAGQCISTTTYATYWALLGSPAPGGCGAGTFAVLDMRGKVPAALDNLNGSAANLLTSSATGCGTAMTSIGATCANGSQSRTLTASLIPTITGGISGTAASTTSSWMQTTGIVSTTTGTAGVNFDAGNPGQTSIATVNSTLSGTFTSTNTGGTTPVHSIVQPTIAVSYLLRVL
jgi:microcystin-dependent protein